jgi:hypothetical protein
MFDADEIITGGESEDSTILTFEKVVDLDRRVGVDLHGLTI